MDRSRKSRYEKIEFLGEGQFATVYKAKDLQDGTIVAVKKLKLGRQSDAADGVNRTALREIKILQELSHPNIICLRDVFGQKSNISLVMDFMDADLEMIIKETTIILQPSHIKSYMLQTLQGCEYLHNYWILHRDLKPNNLLLNRQGVLKVTDFGLAKEFGSPSRQYTNQVVTRWYRAPELLYGASNYGTGVDIWACGCILAELLLRVPFLPGSTDIDQLDTIFQAFGTPTRETWPISRSIALLDSKMFFSRPARLFSRGFSDTRELGLQAVFDLPDYLEFKFKPVVPLTEIFTAASKDLLDLLGWMMKLDPLQRCSATEALKSQYFCRKPAPAQGHELPMPKKEPAKEEKPESRLKRPHIDKDDSGISIKRTLDF